MGCPVFDGMGVFICNMHIKHISRCHSFFTGNRPLHSIHYSLHITNWLFSFKKISMASRQPTAPVLKLQKAHPSPKEIPRRRPPGIPYLQYSMQLWGPVSGKGLAGGGLEGPASP